MAAISFARRHGDYVYSYPSHESRKVAIAIGTRKTRLAEDRLASQLGSCRRKACQNRRESASCARISSGGDESEICGGIDNAKSPRLLRHQACKEHLESCTGSLCFGDVRSMHRDSPFLVQR